MPALSRPNRAPTAKAALPSPLALGVVATAFLWSAGAHGQPTAAERETARGAFARGDDAYDDHDYEGALEAYRAADAIMAIPPTRFAVCEALRKLGQLVEARSRCIEAVQLASDREPEPESYLKARAGAEKLAQELAGRIPSLTLGLPEADDLRVFIDGEAVARAAMRLPLRLDPGPHEVRVEGPGVEAMRITVTLAEGETKTQPIELRPVAPTPAPVRAPSPSAVPTASGNLSPVTWVGFGVGAAGLLVGTITGALALAGGDELASTCADRVCPDSPALRDELRSATTLAHASTASFVIAGAGVATGLLGLLVFDGDDSATEIATVRVGIGAFEITGRF